MVSLAQSNRSNVVFELENGDENIDEETEDDQEDVGNTQNPASATQSSAATTAATCKRKTSPIGSSARGNIQLFYINFIT